MQTIQNKIYQRLFALLAVVLAAAMLTLPSYAVEYYTEGGFQYSIVEEAVSIHSYFGEDATVEIPAIIAELPVTNIEDNAFLGCSAVRVIQVPSSVTSAGADAFTGAIGLQRLINQSPELSPVVPAQVVIVEDFPRYAPPELLSGDGSGTTEPAQTTPNADATQTTATDMGGILQEDGSLVTVDTDKNLISIDPQGAVTVLDNENPYTLGRTGDGVTVILDADGNRLAVDENGGKTDEDITTMTSTMPIVVVVAVSIIALTGRVFWLYRRRK